MMVTELKSKLKLDCLQVQFFATSSPPPAVVGVVVGQLVVTNDGWYPQLKLSKKRPDLTKLDSFLGVLSAEGSFFESGKHLSF
jgi:hypothetical protein